jgi:hypothetical protein
MQLLWGMRLGASCSGVASSRPWMEEATCSRATCCRLLLIGMLGQFVVWLSLLMTFSCSQVHDFNWVRAKLDHSKQCYLLL